MESTVRKRRNKKKEKKKQKKEKQLFAILRKSWNILESVFFFFYLFLLAEENKAKEKKRKQKETSSVALFSFFLFIGKVIRILTILFNNLLVNDINDLFSFFYICYIYICIFVFYFEMKELIFSFVYLFFSTIRICWISQLHRYIIRGDSK